MMLISSMATPCQNCGIARSMPIMRGEPPISMASANRNVRTWEFRQKSERLPTAIQRAAAAAFDMFLEDPSHPALARHELHDSGRGRHKIPSFSFRITMQYRAI